MKLSYMIVLPLLLFFPLSNLSLLGDIEILNYHSKDPRGRPRNMIVSIELVRPGGKSLLLVGFSCLLLAFAAADHSPLRDFCVAQAGGSVLVNGLACKDPKMVRANDFSFSGLHLLGKTSNPVGSKVTPVTVAKLPGLNTLGISLTSIDYAPWVSRQWGINPPHIHPRASEILVVQEGTLEVGFITSNPGNRLVSKVLQKGDVFVFPQGLIHFQRNIGTGNAFAIAALGSQNPGVITIGNAVFGSSPDVSADILAGAFQVDQSVVNQIQSKF
ncbi:putative germin-like protein 2-1 [Rhodamnia argentea]|uniref:Germin-like protein n=1 Tax=Rhodamnia argentea TaxID=178133 RepID=A0ABM3H4N7_9MYRT|nr:putative germin-like protein 2-1 [Rhodamnia argentea]